jgi:hypothetical protein
MSLEIYTVNAKEDAIAGLERYVGIRSVDSGFLTVNTLNMFVKSELTQDRLSRHEWRKRCVGVWSGRRFNHMMMASAPARVSKIMPS